MTDHNTLSSSKWKKIYLKKERRRKKGVEEQASL